MYLEYTDVIAITILISVCLTVILLLTARITKMQQLERYKSRLQRYEYRDQDADYERAKENELWNKYHTSK